jgi:hypothetical protein
MTATTTNHVYNPQPGSIVTVYNKAGTYLVRKRKDNKLIVHRLTSDGHMAKTAKPFLTYVALTLSTGIPTKAKVS